MATEPNIGAIKICGYLEKKGKMKVVTTWKKYWFVLEGRLLLYYRSQEEYENLSPCKGSINMGLATNIRPGLATAGVLEIITRTNTITLRAKQRSIQEKWLQALLDASGQQSATNPIKMTHFRYSMDDLIPVAAKAQNQQQKTNLTRQNTLPYRFKKTNSDLSNNQAIIERLRLIGAQTYGGSLDSIIKKSKQQDNIMNAFEEELSVTDNVKPSEHLFPKTDLCDLNEILIENTEYITSTQTKSGENNCDLNKNSLLIENDQYLKTEDLIETQKEDTVEYYCTYEDINGIKPLNNIYCKPNLPPRPEEHRRSESEDSTVSETKKISKLFKFARRFKNFKTNDNSFKKQSTNLIMKVMGKKKSEEQIDTEPIYDTVNYLEINKTKVLETEDSSEKIVKTLLDLKQTLEEKKSRVKDIIQSTSSTNETTETEIHKENENIQQSIIVETNSVISIATEPDSTVLPTTKNIKNPPSLPPKSGTKSRDRSNSPFHDVPKNNTPVKCQNFDLTLNYSIDKILNDLEQESKKSDDQEEELNVRQLIEKFNRNENTLLIGVGDQNYDVNLRQKTDNQRMTDEDVANIVNRYSDDLNKLLEELTKVTSAPLLTPGVTSSLIQMKSPPITDEEWLVIAPIRRRRFSDPDYDVPRPHRSLQFIPQTPNDKADEAIPATRFFGPVLAPLSAVDKSFVDSSWRSMTPDSLEPFQFLHAAIRKQQLETKNCQNLEFENYESVGDDKISDTELTIETDKNGKFVNECALVLDCDKSNVFMDSLEPLNEGATAF